MLITSFNILADVFIENNKAFLTRWYPSIAYSDLLMRNRFQTMIKYIKGDIVMLQEVTPYVCAKLKEVFIDKYDFMPLSLHNSATKITGNLTMLKRGRFAKVRHETRFLDGYRAFGLTTADDLYIHNIHLSDLSDKTRIRQMKKILAMYDNDTIDKRLIIGGDFNSNSPVLHKLLRDSSFTNHIKEKKGTYICEPSIIDYIYIHGFSQKSVMNKIHNIIDSDKEICYNQTIKKYGSDHHPVYLKIMNPVSKDD